MQKIICICTVVIVLTACANHPAPATAPNPITLTANDNGKTITLAVNQIVVVNLDSNSTTGFKWNLTTKPDERILNFVASNYIAPNTVIPGRGGAEEWKFQAIGVGTTSLRLRYFRPFEPQSVPSEFALTVNVK